MAIDCWISLLVLLPTVLSHVWHGLALLASSATIFPVVVTLDTMSTDLDDVDVILDLRPL